MPVDNGDLLVLDTSFAYEVVQNCACFKLISTRTLAKYLTCLSSDTDAHVCIGVSNNLQYNDLHGSSVQ